MEIMKIVELPEMKKGDWSVEKFKIEYRDWSAIKTGRDSPLGAVYTKLTYKKKLIMSDTLAEQRDHVFAIHYAKENCLINGLGIGLVLKNILLKPEVTNVTVIEIDQDLIDLISPYYSDSRVKIICANAFEYKPPKGIRYQMVWHDIWSEITSNNLKEMEKLHRKYGRKCDWQGSWCKEECKRYK